MLQLDLQKDLNSKGNKMKAIIEHGGLDLKLYDITRVRNETNYLFEGRLAAAKGQIFLDLAFFNHLLDVIYLATDEDDLRDSMRTAFENRKVKNINRNKIPFNFYFGTLPGNSNVDEMDFMEVRQNGNQNRIIYVEL